MIRVAICRGYADGTLTGFEGQYLAAYTPFEPIKGTFTDKVDEAKHYASMEDFFHDWNFTIGVRPWDGKPDRPLTAFNLEVVPIENEKETEP